MIRHKKSVRAAKALKVGGRTARRRTIIKRQAMQMLSNLKWEG